jgi:hypothetical protein
VRGHNVHRRGRITALAIVLLIVAHAVAGIVILKYGWW